MSHSPDYRSKPRKKTPRPPKRGSHAYKAFESNILRLLAFGLDADGIAKRLDCPRRWVTPIVDTADKGFKKLSSEAVDLLRGKEIALIDALQSETLEAFEKSKKPRRVTVVEGRPDETKKNDDGTPKAKPQKITQTTEERAGDIRCIDSVIKLRERYARIMGIDQPVELKHVFARYQEAKDLITQAVLNVFGADSDALDKLIAEIERLESETEVGKAFNS